MEEAKEQTRMNRKTKYYLEKDIKNKFDSKTIDEHVRELNVLSSGLENKDCVDQIPPNAMYCNDLQEFSHELINKAEQDRQNAIKFRSYVDTILQQAHCDLIRQKARTDKAFENRIRETKETKAKLEDHLNQVLTQIREMEENADRLQRALCDQEPALKLAKTRLAHRRQRPGAEDCIDEAQHKLISKIERSILFEFFSFSFFFSRGP